MKEKKTDLEKKLIILADWCKEYKSNYDYETEGVVESLVRRGVDEAINMIGDHLQEIMGATPELTDQFYKSWEKACTTDVCKDEDSECEDCGCNEKTCRCNEEPEDIGCQEMREHFDRMRGIDG